MRLEHIAFNVNDPAALAAWYVANLDMVLVRSFDEPPLYPLLVSDSARKSLIEVYSNPLGEIIDFGAQHAVTFHLAFAVDDMDAAREATGCRRRDAGRRYRPSRKRRQTGVSCAILGVTQSNWCSA